MSKALAEQLTAEGLSSSDLPLFAICCSAEQPFPAGKGARQRG